MSRTCLTLTESRVVHLFRRTNNSCEKVERKQACSGLGTGGIQIAQFLALFCYLMFSARKKCRVISVNLPYGCLSTCTSEDKAAFGVALITVTRGSGGFIRVLFRISEVSSRCCVRQCNAGQLQEGASNSGTDQAGGLGPRQSHSDSRCARTARPGI